MKISDLKLSVIPTLYLALQAMNLVINNLSSFFYYQLYPALVDFFYKINRKHKYKLTVYIMNRNYNLN